MKDLKKIIIILVIIIIIIVIVLLSLFLSDKKEKERIEESYSDERIDYNNVQTESVTSSISFYSVVDCVRKYFDTINKNNSVYYGYNDEREYVKIIDDETIKQNIYNLLSEKYIKDKKITVNNVFEHVENITEQVMFTPLKMDVLKGENSNVYSVYGFIQNMDYKYIKDINIIVHQDEHNSTFAIEQIEEKNTRNSNDILLEQSNLRIQNKENNVYSNPKVNEEYIAKSYFETFKRMLLAKPETSYKILNEEYKKKRFGNYEKYRIYIEKNRKKFESIDLKKYRFDDSKGYTEYVCLDQEKNFYIFKEKAFFDFDVLLDSYTIESEEFLKKYNKGDQKVKEGMNLEKFIEAINNDDYGYAYSVLAESFKQNYYKTQTEFEDYIKSNLYEHNYIEYINFVQEADLGIFTIKLKESEEEGSIGKNMTYIVKLEEGTKYVMSFSMEE